MIRLATVRPDPSVLNVVDVEAIAEFLVYVARSSDLHVAVLGPDARTLIKEVNDQLATFYAASGRGYLNSDKQSLLDARLGLTRRSDVVTVRDCRGNLLSTVRVTPHPFEGKSLMPSDASADSFLGHFELSRLVSRHGSAMRTLSTALALGTALLHARSMGASGLVALARTPQRRVFAKFGLKPTHASPVSIFERENGDYWFLEAPIESVVEAAQSYIKQMLRTAPLLAPSSNLL